MHVKAALAGHHTALVTSANLTGAALLRNMELGLLIKRGPVSAALATHIDVITSRGKSCNAPDVNVDRASVASGLMQRRPSASSEGRVAYEVGSGTVWPRW
jgi:phosphatidylserine/phosphatidylglycerophosphate/cardiolipin synthase-like enzyme